MRNSVTNTSIWWFCSGREIELATRWLGRRPGKAARDFAMAHFGLDRFLADWDHVIETTCAQH